MPKERSDKAKLHQKWLEELKLKDQFNLDGIKFFCQPCSKLYAFKQKGEVKQHALTADHKKGVERFIAKPERQLQLTGNEHKKNPFFMDLTRAMISADIPWNKLENPEFKKFLETYTKRTVPEQSTLAKNYLPIVYGEALEQVRREIGDDPVWISIDETTDACGRFIANVLIGALRKEGPSKCHLVASKQIQRTNHSTIVQVLLDSFQIIWPGSSHKHISSKFLLFISDAVAYMLKAGKTLKATYPTLLHLACLAHGLNRVGEEIRSNSQQVDSLVATLKAVFRKSPNRISLFREINPDLDLPPQPVVTRWGTWLESADYYSRNFDNVKKVVDKLDPKDAVCVKKAQEIMENHRVQQELVFLSANYTFLREPIKNFQQLGASLSQSFDMLLSVESKLASVEGEFGQKILAKFMAVIARNPDLEQVKAINKIIKGEEVDNSKLKLSPADIACFKFSPVTSVDAERSFSMHKAMLSDRRRRMTVKNLEMSLIGHFEL